MGTPDTNPGNFRKSSFSTYNGNCVEVGKTNTDKVAVRDTKNTGGPIVEFNPTAWQSFVARTKSAPRVQK